MTGKKCRFILASGIQCGAWALTGKDRCISHDEESREKKAAAVRKGGEAKEIVIKTPLKRMMVQAPEDIVTLLSQTISEVRDGTLDPRIANTIGYLAGQLVRAFEVAHVDKKIEEINKVLYRRTTY